MQKTIVILKTIALSYIIFTLATVVGINLYFIYYYNYFNNAVYSGSLTRAETFHIYHQLVDYLMPFYFYSFPLVDSQLVSSDSISHFQEVKQVFNYLYLFFIYAFLILLVTSHFPKNNYKYLKYSFYFYFCIIPFILLALTLFFNQSFIIFHQLLFKNDNWMIKDEIINLLPASFFNQTGIAIAVLIIIFSAISYWFYKMKKVIS